jgi:transposase
VNDRRVLNGIFWILRSGAPWRDLPETFGPYTTCYNRFVRWERAGVFSPYLYRARNLVEWFFNKIKQCQRIATRYDKLAANYLAFKVGINSDMAARL